MFVKMLETVANDTGAYLGGEIYELYDAIAASFVRCKVAVQTTQPPSCIGQLLERLDHGADKECLFLPFVGEFGHLILTHIRLVHFHKAKRKIVCCRQGEQVLFPSADDFVTDWTDPVPDNKRIATMRLHKFGWPQLVARYRSAVPIHAGDLSPTQELHCIECAQRIPFRPNRRQLRPDVVLGVRYRVLFKERNWTHWQAVADSLAAHGITFATMGALETSHHVKGEQYHTGDLDTDAAIESLQNCRLYIGTDSGSSHLAATVGCKMLLFRTSKANSRDLFPVMAERNHDITALPEAAWDKPSEVIAAALSLLGQS